jgi:hypothetical protein
MPSHRSILEDIARTGADPAKSYSSLDTEGRLRLPQAQAEPSSPPAIKTSARSPAEPAKKVGGKFVKKTQAAAQVPAEPAEESAVVMGSDGAASADPVD